MAEIPNTPVTNEGVSAHNPPMSNVQSEESVRAATSAGPIIGVEDDQGRLWCLDCVDRELREGGDTPFLMDIHAYIDRRRKCSQCGQRATV